MSIETEPTAGELVANEASASARKKTAAAKPKGAPAPKTRKAASRPPRSSRAKPNGEKLICRYCGSDDLAPFRKRRDARCRACFKQRYGSAARNQKAVRSCKVKGCEVARAGRNRIEGRAPRWARPSRMLRTMNGPRVFIRDESAEAERLLLRIPEQRQVDPMHETEDREIGRLVAFGDRLDNPRRQEAQPQQPPHSDSVVDS